MRSGLFSWNTTLTRLGFRRKRRGGSNRRHAYRRRLALESLEPRQMLSNDPIVVTTLDDVVNPNDDDEILSLREALTEAHDNGSGADTIEFNPDLFAAGPGTISLSSYSSLEIDSNVTIEGPGANWLTIDSNGAPSFIVSTGVTATLRGLSMIGSEYYYVGVDSSAADLTIDASHITGNIGDYVAAVYQRAGTLTIRDSTISGNTTESSYGTGGILVAPNANLELVNSTVSGNYGGFAGGVYFKPNSSGTISSSTITDNHSTSQYAYNYYYGAGGVVIGQTGYSGASVSITNTIIAGNDAAAGEADVQGSYGGSYNLIGGSAGLAALANNGGPVPTHALLSTSNAIDAGDPSIQPNANSYDNRGVGYERVLDGDGNDTERIDIGAFEYAPQLVATAFQTAGADLSISYQILGPSIDTADGLFVDVYRSPDGETVDIGNQDDIFLTYRIDNPAYLTGSQSHTVNLATGADFVDSDLNTVDDYYLIAVLRSLDTPYQHAAAFLTPTQFAGGIFADPDGNWHVQGSDQADVVLIDGGSIVLAGGASQTVTATIDQPVHVWLHGGDDLLSTDSAFSQSITAHGGPGADMLYGGTGEDSLFGGAGGDILDGGAGDDALDGGAGDDHLTGGPGDDDYADESGHDHYDTDSEDTDPPADGVAVEAPQWDHIGGIEGGMEYNPEEHTITFSMNDRESRYVKFLASSASEGEVEYYISLLKIDGQTIYEDDFPEELANEWENYGISLDSLTGELSFLPPEEDGSGSAGPFASGNHDVEVGVGSRPLGDPNPDHASPSATANVSITHDNRAPIGWQWSWRGYDSENPPTGVPYYAPGGSGKVTDQLGHTFPGPWDPTGDPVWPHEGDWIIEILFEATDDGADPQFSTTSELPNGAALDGNVLTVTIGEGQHKLPSQVYGLTITDSNGTPVKVTFVLGIDNGYDDTSSHEGAHAWLGWDGIITLDQRTNLSNMTATIALEGNSNDAVLFSGDPMEPTGPLANPSANPPIYENNFEDTYYKIVSTPTNGVLRWNNNNTWQEVSAGSHFTGGGGFQYVTDKEVVEVDPNAAEVHFDIFTFAEVNIRYNNFDTEGFAGAFEAFKEESNVSEYKIFGPLAGGFVEGDPVVGDQNPPPCNCPCPTCHSDAQPNSNPANNSSSTSTNVGGGQTATHAPRPTPTVLESTIPVPEDLAPVTPTFINVSFYGIAPPVNSDVEVISPVIKPEGSVPGVTTEAGVIHTAVLNPDLPSGWHRYAVDVKGWVETGRNATTGLADESVAITMRLAGLAEDHWLPLIQQDDLGAGPGWNFAGVDRLLIHPQTPTDDPDAFPIYWMTADGYVLTFYEIDGYAAGDPSRSLLTYDGANYILTDKYGNQSHFVGVWGWDDEPLDIGNSQQVENTHGRMIKREDVYGNTITYVYEGPMGVSDPNQDGFAYEPYKVVNDLDGSTIEFVYGDIDPNDVDPRDNKVTSIERYFGENDAAARVTELQYDLNSRKLTKLILPDPDPNVTGDRPELWFTYDSDGRVITSTNADGNDISYTYQGENGSTLVTTFGENGDHTVSIAPKIMPYERLYKGLAAAVVGGGGGAGKAFGFHVRHVDDGPDPPANQLQRPGRFIDELGRVTRYKINTSGFVSEIVEPTGRVTEIQTNSIGQPLSVTVYVDGLLIDQTEYEYDDNFNQTSITYFDNTQESWTYDEFSRLTEYVDELGRTTLYDYHTSDEWDPGAAKQVTIRQVVGTQVAEASDLDDLFTDLYFDGDGLLIYEVVRRRDADANGTQLPSYVTEYVYTNDEKWLESVKRYADHPSSGGITPIGTPIEVIYDNFTAHGEPQLITDERERDTVLAYDGLGRVIQVTSPDPGFNQDQPITKYVYKKSNRIEKVIESFAGASGADEITTLYQYDDRNRLWFVREDSGGANEAVTEFQYDAVGNLTQVTDPLERVTKYEYDLLNRLIRIEGPDPDDYTDRTEWTGVTDGPLAGPVTLLAYDALGRLAAEVDPRRQVTRYEYDARHRLVKIIQPLVPADFANPSTSLESPVTQFVYDDAGQLVQVIDPLERVTETAYDDAGRVVAVTLPAVGEDARTLAFQYDTAGNLRFEVDGAGSSDPRTTEHQYDDLLRLTMTIAPHPTGSDAAGEDTGRPVMEYAYFADGQLQTVTEKLEEDSPSPITRVTSYAYDGAGRLRTVSLPQVEIHNESPASPTLDYFYDGFGRVETVNDLNNYNTGYEYDRLHRVTRVSSPGVTGTPETEYVYDKAGQVLLMKEKLGTDFYRTTSYLWDGLGRLVREVAPDPVTGGQPNLQGAITFADPDPTNSQLNPFTRYEYDAAGNLTKVRTPKTVSGRAWTFDDTLYVYDALGRRTKEIDPNGAVTTFAYDLVGNMAALTDPPTATNQTGNTTVWEYDDRDRVIEETIEVDSQELSRTFEYDTFDNPVKKTDRNERVTTYAFDRLNRLTTESWFADEEDETADREIAFTYDLAGRMLGSSDADHDYHYEYDALDRLTVQTQEIAGLSPVVEFVSAFDAAGNRKELAASLDSTADFVNVYQYDGLNRLWQVTQDESTASGHHAVADKRVNFTYDLVSQLDTMTRYSDVAGANEVLATGFTFDYAGRLTEIDHEAIVTHGYTWDQRGRLTQYVNDYDGTVNYVYDDRGQLTDADYVGNWQTDEDYQYDANGNRDVIDNDAGADQEYDIAADNRVENDGTFSYEYDAEGNRTRRTEDATGDYTKYAWDHRNRLTKVEEYDANGTPTNFSDDDLTLLVENYYDAQNQWIKRVVDPDGDTGSADQETTVFVYENGQAVLQFDRVGGGDVESGDLSHRYLWAAAVDELLADEQVDWTDSDADGEILWALTDHQGSVRNLVDNNGIVRLHRIFDSYGNVLESVYYNASEVEVSAEAAGAVEIIVRWTGKLFDEWARLQNNLHRWYESFTAQWLSEDPIKDGVNWRIYVTNMPTMLVDPDGLQTRAYDLMKEMNEQHGIYQRNAEFAAEVRPVLETTAEVIAETNPISGTLLAECRISTGYDPLRDTQVSGASRRNEALWTFGTVGLGAVLSRLGRFFGKADEALDAANRLRARPLVEQLGASKEEAHFLLNYAMGKTVGSGRVAHHIIPLEAAKELPELMQKAARGGFDINGCNNGFALLSKYHSGNHPEYNQFAIDALKKLMTDPDYGKWTDAQIAGKVQGLADKARHWLSKRRSPLQ